MSEIQKSEYYTCKTHPSLAMIKYWGKRKSKNPNIPITSSLSFSLEAFSTKSILQKSDKDSVYINGKDTLDFKYKLFFESIRSRFSKKVFFNFESTNDFPSSAGLASSSSGFASLAILCLKALNIDFKNNLKLASEIAREGSGSAARAVYGGIVSFPRFCTSASSLYDKNFWPELRVLICVTDSSCKSISSRDAMGICQNTSPYFSSWSKDSEKIYKFALEALKTKDFEKLGDCIVKSYLRMFSTMFSSSPPIIYWNENSVKIINLISLLRKNGIYAYETMDAGPQVKVICLKDDVEYIKNELAIALPSILITESFIASSPSLEVNQF